MDTAESTSRSFLIHRFTPDTKWITRFIDKIVRTFWSSLSLHSKETQSATIGFCLNNGRSVEISTRGLGVANFKFILNKLESGEEELSVCFPHPGILDKIREEREILEPLIRFLTENRTSLVSEYIKHAIQSVWVESLETIPPTTCHEIIDNYLPIIIGFIYDTIITDSAPVKSVTYTERKRSAADHYPQASTVTLTIGDYRINMDYEFWKEELGVLCRESVLRIEYTGNGPLKPTPVTRISSKFGVLGNDIGFPIPTLGMVETWVGSIKNMFNQAVIKTITDRYDETTYAAWTWATNENPCYEEDREQRPDDCT